MSNDIYSDEVLKKVDANNRRFRNGYLVLFDIKNSTRRKKEQPERWHPQLATFYAAIERFSLRVAEISDIFGNTDPADHQPIVKFVGDGGFIFVPHSYHSKPDLESQPPPTLTHDLLSEVARFRSATHSNDALGGMSLKTVVTFLTNLQPVESAKGADIVGRGIDFSFRLETFGDDSYIVVNEMLYRSATRQARDDRQGTLAINGAVHHFVECRKVVKGWPSDNGERFYLLVDPEELQERFTPTISPLRNDVESEVMTFLINRGGRATSASPEAKTPTQDAVEELKSGDGSDG